VIVFGVRNGLIATAPFFLEPVADTAEDIDGAVRRQVGTGTP